jgi:hypothetical protein
MQARHEREFVQARRDDYDAVAATEASYFPEPIQMTTLAY